MILPEFLDEGFLALALMTISRDIWSGFCIICDANAYIMVYDLVQ